MGGCTFSMLGFFIVVGVVLAIVGFGLLLVVFGEHGVDIQQVDNGGKIYNEDGTELKIDG